jgi:putative membrane protein
MPWSWTWHAHPEVWVLVAVLYGGYLFLLARLGPRLVAHGQEVATRRQRRFFLGGIVALLVASEWPVHDLAEGYLYSVHMVQHLLLTLVMAPLLLAGTPSWLMRALFPGRAMRLLRSLSRPLVALIIFNAAIVLTHWPLMVGWATRYEMAHLAQHVVIVGAALVMWMPILSPVLEVPRLSYPGQMMYLFLQSLVPTVPASFLTFGERPLYPIYETFPRVFGISALSDMRTAGLIMKLGGGLLLWIVITGVFFAWSKMERRDGVDALSLHDLDRSMNEVGLER